MQIEIRYRFRGCCYHLASLVHEYNTKTKIIHTWDNFTTKRDRNTRTQNTSKHKIQGWRLRFSFLFSFTYFLVFALALTFAALSLSRSALTKQTHSHTHTRTEMARSLAISFSLSRPRVSYIHMLLRLRACVCAGVCMYGFYDDEKCLLLLHRNQVFCSRFSHFFNNWTPQIRCNFIGRHCIPYSHTLFSTVYQLFSTFSAFFRRAKWK